MKTARYWHMQKNGMIECTLCPRRCRITDRGACFVRKRIGDELIAGTIEGLDDTGGLSLDTASGRRILPLEPDLLVQSPGSYYYKDK